MYGEIKPRILDTRTGEIFPIDPDAARVARLRKRVRAWCTPIGSLMFDGRHRLVMITLTYRPPENTIARTETQWHPNHIRDFMRKLRKRLSGKLLAYVWVAELQKRGEVHYHVLLLVEHGTGIPYPDRGLWPYGMTRIETARKVGYILKYTSKAAFSTADGWISFPKGIRLFAVWLSAEVVDDLARFNFKLSALPKWLEELVTKIGMIVRVKRAKGGGWFITGDTGPPERVASPFRLVSLYG